MIVAIIGVGYLGQQIASYLIAEGIKPLLVTRDVEKARLWQSHGSKVFLLKPFMKSSWDSLSSQCDAMIITVAPTSGASYEETYLTTAQFLAKASPHKPLYYCSSTAVYGEKWGALVDETTPLNPSSPPARILGETEKIYQRLGGTIIRIGELWGEGRRIEERLMRNSLLAGDGSMLTNLTHVSDAARAFVFLLLGHHKGLFNVCGKFHIPRKDFYESLARRYCFPSPFWDPARESSHTGSKIVSTAKIRALGFTYYYESYV